ncbi:unnamed protein product [Aureobasidium pullulans]|nr:unnamed protein product [Aureobasidium pullulans]
MAVSTAYRKASMRRQKVPYLLAIKRYWRPLLGASSTWFLYNWIAIPFGIFSGTITNRVNAGGSLITNLGWGVVINCFYIPGPFIGGYLSDKIGRRKTMALGFAMQAILGDQGAFLVGSAFAVLGALIAFFVIPDVGRKLENEDEAWKRYLEENGWVADWGDNETQDPKGVVINQHVS